MKLTRSTGSPQPKTCDENNRNKEENDADEEKEQGQLDEDVVEGEGGVEEEEEEPPNIDEYLKLEQEDGSAYRKLASFHTLYVSEDNKTILLRASVNQFNTPFFNQFTFIGEEGNLPDMIDCTPSTSGFQLRMAPNKQDVLLIHMQHRLNQNDLAASLYDKTSGGALEGYLRIFETVCVTRKKEPVPMPVDLKVWSFLGGKTEHKSDKKNKERKQTQSQAETETETQTETETETETQTRMKCNRNSTTTTTTVQKASSFSSLKEEKKKKGKTKRHFTNTGPITEVLIDITRWIESFSTLAIEMSESRGGFGGHGSSSGGRSGPAHLIEAKGFPLNMYMKFMTQAPSSAPVKHGGRGGGKNTVYYSVAFCKLPEKMMISRQKDRRVGYFETSVISGATNSVNHEYNVINKWNIERRNHILYCIDPDVPTLYHSTIKQGVLSWNDAFQQAGCGSNVVQCLSIEDDDFPTDYARGDARYSAIYMTDPAIPVYGFGPSLTDFRSGEIIVGHVLLGFSAFTEGTSR